MFKGYRVLTAKTPKGLEKKVAALRLNNYVPVDGARAVVDKKGVAWLIQTMIKK